MGTNAPAMAAGATGPDMADNGGISAVRVIKMSKPKSPARSSPCPCGGAALAACCGPYLDGAAVPQTAEQLMRSRYTAYTQKNEAYLQATWHASTRPNEPVVSPNEKLQWLGLEVKSALRLRQRKAENEDFVEFVARFRVEGRGQRLHEVSRFLREPSPEGPRWFYVDGTFPE